MKPLYKFFLRQLDVELGGLDAVHMDGHLAHHVQYAIVDGLGRQDGIVRLGLQRDLACTSAKRGVVDAVDVVLLAALGLRPVASGQVECHGAQVQQKVRGSLHFVPGIAGTLSEGFLGPGGLVVQAGQPLGGLRHQVRLGAMVDHALQGGLGLEHIIHGGVGTSPSRMKALAFQWS
jgi:hypothetical protein